MIILHRFFQTAASAVTLLNDPNINQSKVAPVIQHPAIGFSTGLDGSFPITTPPGRAAEYVIRNSPIPGAVIPMNKFQI